MQISPVDALRELEPILREIEAERSQRVQQFAQITLWSVVIGGLLSLGLAMFQVGAWALAPLGIALLIVGVAYASKASEWRNTFKTRVMTRLVKLFHPSLNYYPNRAIAEQEYRLSMLFHNSPDPDRYRGEDYIEGVIDKTDIRLSELHTEYRQVTYDSKGNRREYWVTIFRGLFISADFHKHFHGITLVLPDTEQSWLPGWGSGCRASARNWATNPVNWSRWKTPNSNACSRSSPPTR